MTAQNDASTAQPVNWAAIGRGLVVALVLALVLSFISTLLLYFSNLSERFLPWIAAGIVLISVFFGAGAAAARAGAKGLFHGLAVGLGFFVLMWVLGTLLFPGTLNLIGLLEKLLLTLGAGALGGILGVTLAD